MRGVCWSPAMSGLPQCAGYLKLNREARSSSFGGEEKTGADGSDPRWRRDARGRRVVRPAWVVAAAALSDMRKKAVQDRLEWAARPLLDWPAQKRKILSGRAAKC
jgi:hypothetical protein